MSYVLSAPVWTRVSPATIVPAYEAVVRCLGVPRVVGVGDPRLEEAYRQALPLFEDLARPEGGWAVIEPQAAAATLFEASPASPLRPRLASAPAAALFLATLGEGPEGRAAELLASGRYLLGAVLDAVASEAVERLVDRLEAAAAADLHLERPVRFSPGYGRWDLAVQGAVLGAMDAEAHGIRLTESFMMVPRKSVSGVVVPRAGAEKLDPCSLCDVRSCPRG